MDASEFKKMAEAIQAEIESLEILQESTERRLARLKQALLGLVPLGQESSSPDVGFLLSPSVPAEIETMSITDAARQVLQVATAPLAPTEIKQQLLNMGKDLSNQKNVMASIHSLLKRLLENGEVESKDGGLTYQWKGIRRFPRTEASDKKKTWVSTATKK